VGQGERPVGKLFHKLLCDAQNLSGGDVDVWIQWGGEVELGQEVWVKLCTG
jgi:hypothetical protein